MFLDCLLYSEVGWLSEILNTPEYKVFPYVGEQTFQKLAKIDLIMKSIFWEGERK